MKQFVFGQECKYEIRPRTTSPTVTYAYEEGGVFNPFTDGLIADQFEFISSDPQSCPITHACVQDSLEAYQAANNPSTTLAQPFAQLGREMTEDKKGIHTYYFDVNGAN